ncbi:MAG: anaerobic ribonucleoside-triphosphate reductase activating protein [Deltaproteobacteria bacterium]|nr:anaerobic ribonucleoside-triphosphate reductase activating protein [Deltaproteobacteria bacterium]
MTTDQLPPIKGFLETSLLDWPGHVCAVVFLPYCNLRCPYCHNHRLVLHPDTLETLSLESVLARVAARDEWIDGVCVTGGEPTIHRGLPAMLEAIHEAGLRVKLDTNGTQPEILKHLITKGLVDTVAMDVKAPLDDALYERCAGVYVPASLITSSIEVLLRSGIPAEFRCTAVPLLLKEGEIFRLAEDLRDLALQCAVSNLPKLTIQNFNPADPMDPALKDAAPFDEKVLSGIQKDVDAILDAGTGSI